MNEIEIIAALDHPEFGLDGKWSSQTKYLLAQHGTFNLELNKWWAVTPQNWRCPSCDRSKLELAKLSRTKCLVAKLVSHHDHANERVEAQAPVVWKENGSREPIAYALREHLKRLAMGILTRFPPTIVCEDCNNLEPLLKQKLGIPNVVTLTPTEIGRLRNYNRTTVDPSLEGLIFQLVEWAAFSATQIEQTKQSFSIDLHQWNKDWFNAEVNVKSRAEAAVRLGFQKQILQQTNSLNEFLKLSVSAPTGANSNPKKLPAPTQDLFLNFKHPHPLRQSVIDKAPVDWHCPICYRNKFECFISSRGSNTKFVLNLLERTIVFESGNIEEAVIICGDCNDFHNELVRYCNQHKLLEIQPFFETRKIDADAVRHGIVSAPHQRHVFNTAAAVSYMKGLFDSTSDFDVELDY
jgi:rubredoxin